MGTKNQCVVCPDKLRGVLTDVFVNVGLAEEDAVVVATNLVDSNLCGVDTHGIMRLVSYIERFENGTFSKENKIQIIREAPSTACIDAGGAIGILSGEKAMRIAMEKARQTGVAAVSVYNSGHFGAAGYFTRMAAKENMIGFACTNGLPAIAPWGGTRPYHGTNPFAVGVPSREDPIVLDMATSVVARGKVMLAKKEGKAIPEGWALDKNGCPTTDPTEALAGTMFPVGGVKGYGIALIIDLLCAALSGADVGTHLTPLDQLHGSQNLGHFFIAIDVEKFRPADDFLDDVEMIKNDIKSLPRIEGVEKIMMPGEPESDKKRERTENGIQIPPAVYRDLEMVCERFGVCCDVLK